MVVFIVVVIVVAINFSKQIGSSLFASQGPHFNGHQLNKV